MIQFDKYKRLGAYHWRDYERPTVYRSYVDGLRTWVRGLHILDVGAGDGLITSVIGARGVELDPIAVSLARARGVDVVQGDAAALPFADSSFDTVFMGDVIEHLPSPVSALLEAYRVLKPEGVLYVTTPPEKNPVRPYHYREYTPAALEQTIVSLGFALKVPMFIRHDRIHAEFSKASRC